MPAIIHFPKDKFHTHGTCGIKINGMEGNYYLNRGDVIKTIQAIRTERHLKQYKPCGKCFQLKEIEFTGVINI